MSKAPPAHLLDPNAAVLQKLKDAVNAKMLSNQQHLSTSTSAPLLGAGVRRQLSRKEDIVKDSKSPKLSPTLAASFDSPLHTTSTESTESTKTVRGSALPTPALPSLKTPSYPFPHMSGPQRTWNPSFHRPFTALSPTVSAEEASPRSVGDVKTSLPNTPVPSASAFMPPGYVPSPRSDIDQDNLPPTPNLYDLVLMLNLEPGMTSWWTSITTLFQEFYGADRMSLSLPADAGEMENVPWGQKATFCLAGKPHSNSPTKQQPSRDSMQHRSTYFHSGQESSPMSPSGKPNLLRPNFQSRHSYAGFEREPPQATPPSKSNLTASGRPTAMRTKSLAPNIARPSEHNTDIVSPAAYGPARAPERLLSTSDTEFSAIHTENVTGPYTHVLHSLRALDYESQALLDATSVNKIIERGKLVVLTRDFSAGRKIAAEDPKIGKVFHPLKTPITSKPPLRPGLPSVAISLPYEEYEQMPSSPWSQSPAPSPAVQADPEENPFFAQTNFDEGSFKPPEKTADYSHTGPVEAIGIDKASTVLHIPLIHPRASYSFSARHNSTSGSISRAFGITERTSEGKSSPLKRAPIAILSLSVPVVPYPQNLLQSLQLFAPHLAASYEMAQHYSTVSNQLNYRQYHGPSMGEQNDTLGSLADFDLTNDSTSLTSPSDYSGRSRQSPGGSVGTPGWDHGITGFTSHHGFPPTTPSQKSATEMVDSYFDAKTRVLQSTSHGASAQAQSKTAEEGYSRDNESSRKANPDDKAYSQKKTGTSTKPVVPETKRRPHSLLHSYGADFNSTFQPLPSSMTPTTQTPSKLLDVGGITTSLDHSEMPPPSERLLRTIVDSLPVQIFTASPGTGVISWVNSKFIVYRNQETSAIINDPWKAIHPEDRPGYLEEWKKSLSTGQQFSHKVRLCRFDGAYRWFFVRATPLKDRRQKIVHWAGTYMDVHEQHVAEVHASRQQETAASEAKYRALANSSPQIVFAVTRSRGVVFCNSQWITYSGQTEEQAMGMGFMDYVHQDDLAKCRLPTLNPDGSVEVDAPTSIPPPSKEAPSTNEGSEHSSESGQTITSPDPETPNPSQIPQSSLYKLASTGILKLSRDQEGRPSYSTEVRLRSKEGRYRWHLVRVLLSEVPRGDENDNEETWYGTCTDINDHKILEQTLKDTMDAKSRFLSNMSHEIRTPLNGILGMVNFLIDSSLSNEQMEHVNIIRNSTEGLRDLINDILDLSKVEAGMITLNKEWMHIRSLIEEVNDIMFALAVDKGLELNYSIEPDVPAMVKGDRFRIRQVLINIVGNAIKFTSKGEIFVKCEVESASTMDLGANDVCLRFQVIDTGKGFNENEAEFLFKRFSQIDSAGAKAGSGTGLGLAISMQLVELHGGSMKATSEPGKGSTFTFFIKCQVPSSEDRPSITATSSSDASMPSMAAVIPTPLPVTETSQGFRFGRTGSQEQVSPVYSPSPRFPHINSAASSGSSDPSLHTAASSIRSERSSVSSAEMVFARSPPIPLELPSRIREHLTPPSSMVGSKALSEDSVQTVRPSSAEPAVSTTSTPIDLSSGDKPYQPPMFSVLVICPLIYTRESISKHIQLTLPKMTPHHITARQSVAESKDVLFATGNEEPIRFSHVVLDLPDVAEIISVLEHLFATPSLLNTCAVIIVDVKQRREIATAAPQMDFKKLATARRVRFLFKPLKPSKLAVVFDPQNTSEVAIEQNQNQNSAQAVAMTQKMIFSELKERLGDRNVKVLLVEDNKTSQMVLSRFLARVGISVEVVDDGEKATRKFFEKANEVRDHGGKMWDLIFVSFLFSIDVGLKG
jgi:signal transduction histidine kinase